MPSILEAVRGKGGPIDCLQGLVKALGKKDKRTKVEMLVTLVTLDYVDVKESQQFSSRDCYLSYRSPTHPSFSKLLNFLLYLGHFRRLFLVFYQGETIGSCLFFFFWILSLDAFLVPAAAAKSLQSCPTLCDPIDGSPPGSPVPGILQARTLEWVAISFSNASKWKVKVKSLSHV